MLFWQEPLLRSIPAVGTREFGHQSMAEQSLAENIAQRLRRDILRGRLTPGSSIKERDNAAELGVSRTPMREAIRILAKEGLVILRPSRSPIVAQPSLQEITDSVEVLTALEMLSLALACERASDADIADIRRAEQALKNNYDQYDQIERFEADMELHIAIVRAAHNPTLAETHMSYLMRLWHARFQAARSRRTKERVLRQHAALVGMLESRDVAAAQHELAEHLKHLMINVRLYFENLEQQAIDADRRVG